MDSVKQCVLATVNQLWSEQVAFLQELVSYPSVLFQEASAQEAMRHKFHAMGLAVDSFDADISGIGVQPGYSHVEWGYQGRPQVVGVLKSPAGGGRNLVLNGHVDVVSAEPVRQWQRPPFGGKIDGDRLYGRGACDMKGGVSAMTFAVQAIQQAGVALRGDVILQSVIEEECTGNGTLACLTRGYVGDAALIPEPGEQILIGELGVLWLRTVVSGLAGHVQGASRQVNAIDKAIYLIGALRELEAKWNANPHPAFASHDHPINFNLGVIRAGDWPSTVPAECEFVTRVSFYPGLKPEEAKAEILTHLQAAIEADPFLAERLPEFSWYGHNDEGYILGQDHPYVQEVARAYTTVTGRPARFHFSTAVTDARYWTLYHDLPAVCMGPNGENIHAPDEWVSLSSLHEVTRVIAAFILDFCGYEQQLPGR